jgi:hypothetical protein
MFGLFSKKQKAPKPDEMVIVIRSLEHYISHVEKNDWDNLSKYEWDDYMGVPFDDERAEALRLLCHQVSDAFHGKGMTTYSAEGMDILKAILGALKKERLSDSIP